MNEEKWRRNSRITIKNKERQLGLREPVAINQEINNFFSILRETNRIKLLDEGAVIVDLGGGVGLFSDYIKQNYKNSQSYNVDLIPPNNLEKSKYKKNNRR